MGVERITAAQAEGILDALRLGVPPLDHVRALTVGREEQVDRLGASLMRRSGGHGALLLRARYGAGKSHLLRVVREIALEQGYAVSLVEVNDRAVRFNRMDKVFGAVCRGIEFGVEGRGRTRGIRELFNRFVDTPDTDVPVGGRSVRDAISGGGRWRSSDALACPAMFVALRAWVLLGAASHDLVADWLSYPYSYTNDRKHLYESLVASVYSQAPDPRPEWMFYRDNVFTFGAEKHAHAWYALADLDVVARASGLRGMVLLFDEFEDIFPSLNNRAYQAAALDNLLRLHAGSSFPGMAYFAVTPEFVRHCQDELWSRGLYGFDLSKLAVLPTFDFDPLTRADGLELAKRLRRLHGCAYGWDSVRGVSDASLKRLVSEAWQDQLQHRVRDTIQRVVETLDDELQSAGTAQRAGLD